MSLRKVVICAASRTPIGKIGGGLSVYTAPQLLRQIVQHTVNISKVDPKLIQICSSGWVMQDPRGATMAETAARAAGALDSCPGTLTHEQCSSGAVSVHNIARQIMLGEIDLGLGCGVESMSNIPRHLYVGRNSGVTYGAIRLEDGVMDGLTDFEVGKNGTLVGALTDKYLVPKYKVTREQQDDAAYWSHHNACDAWDKGFYHHNNYIMKVEQPGKRGKPGKVIDKDEGCRRITKEELSAQAPYFLKKEEGGTVTAGNSSMVSDGAACVLLASETRAKELGLPILAELVSFARSGCARETFGEGAFFPLVPALQKAGLKTSDIDFFEINEAFAAVVASAYNATDLLGKVEPSKTNQWGSGCSLGHPVGCTGVRQIVDMIHQMKQRGGRLGYTGRCAGGGKGTGEIVKLRDEGW